MPITGKFVADFENFKAGADDAVVRLAKIEKGADAVDKAAKRMTKPGAGGTSGFSQMATELQQFDRILGVVGVNLGGEIGALKELGTIATTAGSSLGALGPAALVAGSAIGGWQIGRWIADVGNFDQAIVRLAAHMKLIPDAAEEAGKAQADVFKRATELTGQTYQTQAAAQAAINAELEKRGKFFAEHKAAMEELNGSLFNQKAVLAGISGEVIEGAKYLLEQKVSADKISAIYGITLGQVAAINKEYERGLKLTKEQSDEFQQRQSQIVAWQQQRQTGAVAATQSTLGDYGIPTQIQNLRALDEQLRQANLAAVKALENEQFWQEELVKDDFERSALEAKHAEERMRLLQDYGKQHVAILEQIRQKQREQMTESTQLFTDALSKINDLQKAAYERRGLVGEGAEAGQVQRTKTPQEEYDKAVKEAARAAEMLLAQTQNAAAAQQLYDALVKDASDRFVIASGGFIQNFSQAGATVAVFGKSVQDTVSKLEIISGESGEGPLVGVFGNTPESVYNKKPKTGMFNPFSLPGFSLSGPSPGVTYNVTVNGVWDPRTKAEFSDALADVVARTRQWPNR